MNLQASMSKFDDLLDYLLYRNHENIRVSDCKHSSSQRQFGYNVHTVDIDSPLQYMIEVIDTTPQPAYNPAGYGAGTIGFPTSNNWLQAGPANVIYIYSFHISFDASIRMQSYAYTKHVDRLEELTKINLAQKVDDAVKSMGDISGFSRHSKIKNLTDGDPS